MERFSAEVFFEIGALLERLQHMTSMQAEIEQEGQVLGAQRIDVQKRKLAETRLATLRVVKTLCPRIGLRQPPKHVMRLETALETGELNHTQIETAIAELHARIRDEMEDHLFMYIPPQQASSYDQPELFGKEVNLKFPNIQFDLVEAGNCYATGRSTAVVFHLMRIMEAGVQAFGTKLGVTLTDEKNWQNILDETDKAIKALPRTAQRVQMSQASANLYAVKLAWRNEVMHPKDTYTLEEADNLIRQVKIFMEQLATIV
jgi:hypothetical protein